MRNINFGARNDYVLENKLFPGVFQGKWHNFSKTSRANCFLFFFLLTHLIGIYRYLFYNQYSINKSTKDICRTKIDKQPCTLTLTPRVCFTN